MINSLPVIRWDDEKVAAIGLNPDSSRIDFDFTNGCVSFQNNARYPDEPLCHPYQLPHKWLEGSEIRPHIHWGQQSINEPNWLLAYKVIGNGDAFTVETDYTNYIFRKKVSNAFTYTDGALMQITQFGGIDMTGYKLSDLIAFVLFRDSLNTSGLFSGADPSSLDELLFYFDVHIQVSDWGSRQEYVK